MASCAKAPTPYCFNPLGLPRESEIAARLLSGWSYWFQSARTPERVRDTAWWLGELNDAVSIRSDSRESPRCARQLRALRRGQVSIRSDSRESPRFHIQLRGDWLITDFQLTRTPESPRWPPSMSSASQRCFNPLGLPRESEIDGRDRRHRRICFNPLGLPRESEIDGHLLLLHPCEVSIRSDSRESPRSVTPGAFEAPEWFQSARTPERVRDPRAGMRTSRANCFNPLGLPRESEISAA